MRNFIIAFFIFIFAIQNSPARDFSFLERKHFIDEFSQIIPNFGYIPPRSEMLKHEKEHAKMTHRKPIEIQKAIRSADRMREIMLRFNRTLAQNRIDTASDRRIKSAGASFRRFENGKVISKAESAQVYIGYFGPDFSALNFEKDDQVEAKATKAVKEFNEKFAEYTRLSPSFSGLQIALTHNLKEMTANVSTKSGNR